MCDNSNNIFRALKQEVIKLYVEWTIYKQLFGSEKRVELLNNSAPQVFHVLQSLVLDKCVLVLSRITDPARMGKFENLTISKLEEVVANENPELAEKLEKHRSNIEDLVDDFRQHRNKHIAHLDLGYATGSGVELKKHYIDSLDQALNAVCELLNEYEYNINNSTTAYDQIILPLGYDGEALLRRLKESLAYQAAELGDLVEKGMWKRSEYGDA